MGVIRNLIKLTIGCEHCYMFPFSCKNYPILVMFENSNSTKNLWAIFRLSKSKVFNILNSINFFTII